MGEVYRALDEMLDRDVALKMLKPELPAAGDGRPLPGRRYAGQARSPGHRPHPRLLRHDDRLFIVMEFVRANAAAQLPGPGGCPGWRWCDGCRCSRPRVRAPPRRIHRDMKPANVLMGLDGAVKVTDFGIARVLGPSGRRGPATSSARSSTWRPSRSAAKKWWPRDLYAVGILLYELLTGRVPFRGSAEYEVMMQHLQAPVPSVRPLARTRGVVRRDPAGALPRRCPIGSLRPLLPAGHRRAGAAEPRCASRRPARQRVMDAAVVGATGPLARATIPRRSSRRCPGR